MNGSQMRSLLGPTLQNRSANQLSAKPDELLAGAARGWFGNQSFVQLAGATFVCLMRQAAGLGCLSRTTGAPDFLAACRSSTTVSSAETVQSGK